MLEAITASGELTGRRGPTHERSSDVLVLVNVRHDSIDVLVAVLVLVHVRHDRRSNRAGRAV